MSKFVTFGLYYQAYGRTSLELPDEINENDTDAIRAYIKENWDSVPIPTSSDYIPGSDEMDEESIITVYSDDQPAKEEIRFPTDGMSAENDLVRVEWYNADEGWCGDYDPDDPDDENLLRFDVYIRREGNWEAVEDASYCTRMPADTKPEILKRALELLLKEYTDVLRSDPYASVKKLGEGYSWMSPEWFKPEITKNMIREGLQRGIVRYVLDPNGDGKKGTVCQIGDHWFYQGGLTAESETPEEYVRNVPVEDRVSDIFETLECFKREPEFNDEYAYYAAFIQENLKETVRGGESRE